MDQREPSIEVFRREISELYTAKGVLPPQPGSEEEKQLYEQWLKGKKIVTQSSDHVSL